MANKWSNLEMPVCDIVTARPTDQISVGGLNQSCYLPWNPLEPYSRDSSDLLGVLFFYSLMDNKTFMEISYSENSS